MILLFLFAFIAFLYVFYCILPTYYYKWFKKPSLIHGETDKKIFLTFDDGPDPRFTAKILKILAENHVRAVFFVVAKKAAQNPELIHSILDSGHLVELHSLEHKSAWQKGRRYMKRDFKESLLILNSLGCKINYYRPAWGHFNLSSVLLAKKHNLKILLWTVMAQDWEKKSTSQRILKRLIRRTKNGSVICLHDSGEGSGGANGAPLTTIEALSLFLPIMLKDGYQFILPDNGVL